uniref:Uncharacterized protein n=1 Tax=Anguilla anguilla TaxID=7936 RepID=A0A0E9VY45_ANGAN
MTDTEYDVLLTQSLNTSALKHVQS